MTGERSARLTAPHGASAAACAVCGWETTKRVAEGDGFVPICSTRFCLQAWPRVRDLLDRADSAELGCEIAYRREPTQAEGDAHADGADECFVTMGGWTGRRCRACGRWVWGGPTACDRCVGREPLASGFCPDCEQMVNLLPVAEKSPNVAGESPDVAEKSPLPECSICRGRHGREVTHACE